MTSETPNPDASMFNNANANIQGGEFINANSDFVPINFNSAVETILNAVPVFLAELQKVQSKPTTDRNTGTNGSQLEGEPVTIEMAESGPSQLLETGSIADTYTRSMLKCLAGYPLYVPQPYSDLSEEYMREGVRIGDVGIVTKDGAFDFLFNICPSQNSLINPPNLPSGFTLETYDDIETNYIEQFPHETHIFASPVSRINNLFQGSRYTSSEAGGAILELPEGALVQNVTTSTFPFRRLASRSGKEWYKYAMGTRGRDILNGSLYLVTSCTKCTQWGIAVFDLPCTPQDSLRFVQNKGLFRDSGSKYRWKGSSTFTTKVAPSLGSNRGDSPNQCVFLNGYMVKLRQDIFDDLHNDLLCRLPQASSRSSRSRMERNSDISIPTQVSTPRPQPVDHFSGDEGHPGVLQAPPTASEPQAPGDRNARNREVAQDNEPGILIASPSTDHSPINAKNEDDHSIPIQTETPLIAPEYHSIDRGGENVPSRKAGHGVDPDFSIPNSNFDEVRGNATIVRFGDGQFTEDQRNLIGDYIANPTLLPDIKANVFEKHLLTKSIISLPRAEALFNDDQTKKNSGPCFGGTRVALLRETAHWVTSPDGSGMCMLSGLAGIGKSTVAYTLASRAADLNLLGASFFFSREGTDCNNGDKFFTTIAYQLCVYNETFAKAIGDVLNTELGIAATTADPQVQLQVLILQPLQSIVQSRVRPILVVVDALDECDVDDERAVVTGLGQLTRELPSFKVILTTRPPLFLDSFFGSWGGHKIFHLQDIEDKVVDGDIRLYLKHYLSLLQVQEHYPKRQWCANDEEIESLVRASRRLFIIASRAVRYILDESASNPAAQMQQLLHAFAQGCMPFKDLDEIQQDFDMNFGRVVFGWGTILGILTAILVHQR